MSIMKAAHHLFETLLRDYSRLSAKLTKCNSGENTLRKIPRSRSEADVNTDYEIPSQKYFASEVKRCEVKQKNNHSTYELFIIFLFVCNGV